MKDWLAWHESYDDPASSLSRRLGVVRRRLDEVLDELGDGELRLLSLCAGDGRDVIPVLAARPISSSVSAVLIEFDETLSRSSAEAARLAGLENVTTRCADAGDLASFDDTLPVGVLLLCGIFGNVEHNKVKDIIEAVPRLLAPGGFVIWTRGASAPDRRPEVRSWFIGSGLNEVSFDGAPEAFGVGVNRLESSSAGVACEELPARLFTFVAG